MNLEAYEKLLNDSFRRTMFEMAHEKIKKLYDDEFLVYPKCIFGNRRVTIYYISLTKFVIVNFGYDEKYKSNEFPIKIKETNSKILSKELTFQQKTGGIVELNLKFEDGSVIEFHNLNDSNYQWQEDFYESIISIYKEI